MRLDSRALAFLVALAGASASVQAQTMIASSPTSGTSVNLFVLDPGSGAHLPYMTVTVPAGRELRFLAALPDNTLVGSLYEIGNANASSLLLKIDPRTGISTAMSYGPPLDALYEEGMDYSPRHNALLVGFGAAGTFGTNRLALVNPSNGAVLSSTGVLAGIDDLDYIASSPTMDLVFDLNGPSDPRVKNLTTLMPNPTFGAFASPPSKATSFDTAINPSNGDVWFVDGDGTRIVKLVGNAYVSGPMLTDGAKARGLAFAYLPPRALTQQYSGICPGHSTTIHVVGVGTPPFTYQWYKGAALIDPSVTPSAATTSLLVNANADGEGNYHCVISNDYGAFTSPDIPFSVCRSDFNCDALVNDQDFTVFAVGYNILDCADPTMPPACPADLNLDGVVDDADFMLFVQAYNRLLCSL
ncbi:MAG: hypothetical protein KF805_00775 [Phycisphaeraceae bacterium]|nr:hypothetical protein [Phycisphaeraceae bacterium]